MNEDLHDDVREIRNLVTQNLAKTVKIESALWPDEGQPSLLTKHGEAIKALEGWRNILNGIWIALTTIASVVFGIHVHGGSK
jgi:hypothetical protein